MLPTELCLLFPFPAFFLLSMGKSCKAAGIFYNWHVNAPAYVIRCSHNEIFYNFSAFPWILQN